MSVCVGEWSENKSYENDKERKGTREAGKKKKRRKEEKDGTELLAVAFMSSCHLIMLFCCYTGK